MEELLYQALASPLGIIVVTSDDPEAVRQKLYRVRAASEVFSEISLVMSPTNPQQIWLVKNVKV